MHAKRFSLLVVSFSVLLGCGRVEQKMDHLCESAADLGYTYAQCGYSREQLHKDMKETLSGKKVTPVQNTTTWETQTMPLWTTITADGATNRIQFGFRSDGAMVWRVKP